MEIKKIAIIGAGFMGSSIAQLCAMKGYKTTNIDISIETLDAAEKNVNKNLHKLVDKGVMTPAEVQKTLEQLHYSDNLEDISGSDIVIEAVSENMDLKKNITKSIENLVSKHTLILSNTSGLSITEISSVLKDPTRFMAAHFFSPPTRMKLVELSEAEDTSSDTFNKTKSFIESLGKETVKSPELPGFIVNRLLIQMINEASLLLMSGAQKEDIDQAMKLGANHRMGPLELGDFIGLDVVLAIMNTFHKSFQDEKYKPSRIIIDLVNKGHLGRKTNQGFYTY